MKINHLQNHPEGGKFEEVFRSVQKVTTDDNRQRDALTHIYFELQAGETSAWHKVTSDEVWNLYEGELKLYLWDGTDTPPREHLLSAKNREYCEVVAAGEWQAAVAVNGSCLVGCSVGPGFDFEDFTMMRDCDAESQQVESNFPAFTHLI